MQVVLLNGLIDILNLLQLILILRILLSWFPNINWYNQPFKLLDDITEPVLTPFRRIIPPIAGMIDISPIVPIFLINILIGFLAGMVPSTGF